MKTAWGPHLATHDHWIYIGWGHSLANRHNYSAYVKFLIVKLLLFKKNIDVYHILFYFDYLKYILKCRIKYGELCSITTIIKTNLMLNTGWSWNSILVLNVINKYAVYPIGTVVWLQLKIRSMDIEIAVPIVEGVINQQTIFCLCIAWSL